MVSKKKMSYNVVVLSFIFFAPNLNTAEKLHQNVLMPFYPNRLQRNYTRLIMLNHELASKALKRPETPSAIFMLMRLIESATLLHKISKWLSPQRKNMLKEN